MSKNYIAVIFSFIFLISGACQAHEFEFGDFLGTMGGKQVYLKSNEKDGQETYSRSFIPFGPADLRVAISKVTKVNDGFQFKTIGESYSFTPWRLRDGRPFGSNPTSMQGGGFFLTLKELDGKDASLFSFQYTLNILGKNWNTFLEFQCKRSRLKVGPMA